MGNTDLCQAVQIDETPYRRITLMLPEHLLDGMIACARRDSRTLDHLIEVAMLKYIESRKL